MLGPGVNIYRALQNGRNMEYYGEDPYLAGSTAVGLIDGVQSQGVVATIKHFAANNSEYDRRQLDSVIAPRPLHEIYLRAFEMAVKQGRVGAVMSSYNQIDGQYTAENRDLVSGILKHDWGFDGLFMSDWGAVDDGLKAFKAGLDLEMPAADKMQPSLLLPALRDGTLSSAELDDKVRRILRTGRDQAYLGLTPGLRPASGQQVTTGLRRREAVAVQFTPPEGTGPGAVGTLVEPPGEVGTFSGHTTVDGVTTAYDDAPLTQVLPDDAFADYVCRAVTGG